MKTHSWHRFVVSWIGMISLLYVFYSQKYNLFWLIPSYIIYYIIALASTVGYHRLFNHASFQCHTVWHWLFSIIGCIGLNSSPFYWSIVHSGHHKYSDTDNDPYEPTWKFFFRIRDRNLKPFRNDFRLMRDLMHKHFNEYSYSYSFLYMMFVGMFFGINGLLFLYFIPVGLYIWGVGVHTLNAHTKDGPRNLWWMEFIVPMGGEWLHGTHHQKAWLSDFRTKWYHYDPGYILIRLIRH